MSENQQPVGRPPVKQNEILETLREQIVSGELSPGSRLPLRMDLQEQFNASVSTVQSALSRLIEDGFVKPRGRRGTFVCKYPPHLSTIGLALPAKPVAAEIQSRAITGLAKAAEKLDDGRTRRFRIYEGITGHSDSEADQHLLNDILAFRVGGVVYAFPEPNELAGSVLTCQDTPSVLIQTHGDPSLMPRVEPDMRAFIDMALQALIEDNCKSIGVIAVSGTRPEHLAHFKQAVRKLNLQLEDRWIQSIGWPEIYWANNVAQAMFYGDADERPDGLIILDDNITDDVVAGIKKIKRSVPDELKIVTHCNFPCPKPAIPMKQLGFDPAELLLAASKLIEKSRDSDSSRSLEKVQPTFRDAITASRK